MKEPGIKAPRARKDQLIVKEVRDEVLIYDLKTYKAHCLNDTAARVWKNCDGKRSVSEISRQLETDLKTPVDDQVVWLALDQLGKSNLMQGAVARPAAFPRLSRRDLIRNGIAAAIALPLVVAISAPTAQAAGTPISDTICIGRHQSDPGGCGGNPCTPPVGATCINGPGNTCKCA